MPQMDLSLFPNILITTITVAGLVYSAHIFRLNSENIELKILTSSTGLAILSLH